MAIAMILLGSASSLAQEGVSNAGTFKQATYDLIQQLTGLSPVTNEAGIYLSDLSEGPAEFLVNGEDCTNPIAEDGWFVADSVLSSTNFELDASDLAAGIVTFREVVVQGTLSGAVSAEVVTLSAYVVETPTGTTISAVAQRWRLDPSADDVDYDTASSSAAGGQCEADCIRTWRAQDAIALAAYRTTTTTIALNLRKCLKDAKKECAWGGGAGCVLLGPALGVVVGGSCYLVLSLDCADVADVARTAALNVLEAARNANAETNRQCIKNCRAAAVAPPATPAPITTFGVLPTSGGD